MFSLWVGKGSSKKRGGADRVTGVPPSTRPAASGLASHLGWGGALGGPLSFGNCPLPQSYQAPSRTRGSHSGGPQRPPEGTGGWSAPKEGTHPDARRSRRRLRLKLMRLLPPSVPGSLAPLCPYSRTSRAATRTVWPWSPRGSPGGLAHSVQHLPSEQIWRQLKGLSPRESNAPALSSRTRRLPVAPSLWAWPPTLCLEVSGPTNT